MLCTKYYSIWQSSKIFNVSANKKQESSRVAMFLSARDEMGKLYKGPSIDAPYRILRLSYEEGLILNIVCRWTDMLDILVVNKLKQIIRQGW